MNHPLNILLIDDNSIDLYIHKMFLEKSNLPIGTITEYSNATEALKYLIGVESEQFPNLILLDIQMPIMNGFEFLEQFMSLPDDFCNHSHIIMLSSSVDTNDSRRARANHFVLDIMEKPINISLLKNILIQHQIIKE